MPSSLLVVVDYICSRFHSSPSHDDLTDAVMVIARIKKRLWLMAWRDWQQKEEATKGLCPTPYHAVYAGTCTASACRAWLLINELGLTLTSPHHRRCTATSPFLLAFFVFLCIESYVVNQFPPSFTSLSVWICLAAVLEYSRSTESFSLQGALWWNQVSIWWWYPHIPIHD